MVAQLHNFAKQINYGVQRSRGGLTHTYIT